MPPAPHVPACRVVSSSMSARLLLAGQLRALDEIDWSVLAGDEYPDPLDGVTVHHVAMRREPAPADVVALFRLVRFFRRHRYAFVQTHTPKASMLGLPAAKLAGLPTLYTVHGSMYFRDNGRVRNAVAWVFERWCCAWADRVLVQSNEDATALPRARLAKAGKVRWIGNGIDLTRFASTPPRERGDDKPVLLMISRLVAEKGCRDFFRLAERLHHVARFVHVGMAEPDQRDAIPAAEIAALAESGVVEFMGEAADVRPFIEGCDLLVHPSYREGMPRVVMEAAAMGRPVVGYDIRGMREVLPADARLLVPLHDVDALAARTAELVERADELPALGAACRDWVREHFSEQGVVARLREIYAEVLAER